MSETSQSYLGDIPDWDLPTIPTDAKIRMFTVEADPDGCDQHYAYYVPLTALTGGTSVQTNQCSMFAPGNDITITDGTVVPVYQENNTPYRVNKASAASVATLAQDLAIKVDPNQTDYLIVQHDGYYKFDAPHNYTIGQTYYLSDTSGQVVTVPGTEDQPLFRVIDNRKIRILL